jgi:hypothetical protein
MSNVHESFITLDMSGLANFPFFRIILLQHNKLYKQVIV